MRKNIAFLLFQIKISFFCSSRSKGSVSSKSVEGWQRRYCVLDSEQQSFVYGVLHREGAFNQSWELKGWFLSFLRTSTNITGEHSIEIFFLVLVVKWHCWNFRSVDVRHAFGCDHALVRKSKSTCWQPSRWIKAKNWWQPWWQPEQPKWMRCVKHRCLHLVCTALCCTNSAAAHWKNGNHVLVISWSY